MKKTLSLLGMIFILSAILTLSCLATGDTETPVAEGSCGEGDRVVNWKIVSNSDTIEGFPGSTCYTMKISGTGAFVQPDRNKVEWEPYLRTLTRVEVGDNITHLSSNSFAMYSKTDEAGNPIKDENGTIRMYERITTVVLGKDVVSLGNAAFAGCHYLTTIYRNGNTPEEGTFDLTGITYFGTRVFDGCWAVENIILPEDGSYSLDTEFLKSNQKLKSISIPAACASISPLAFRGCSALENVYIEGDTDIIAGYITSGGEKSPAYAFHDCGKNTTTLNIYAKKDTPAHNYANNYNYIEPCNVEIKLEDNTTLATVQVVETFKMSPIYDHEYVSYIIFLDEGCTKLISDTVITKNTTNTTTVYAKPLFEFIGYMVRIADHHGLRAIFEYDRSVFKDLEGFTVKEVGVLGGKKMGINPTLTLDSKDTDKMESEPTLTLDSKDTNKMVIWKDDVFVGKLIEYPKDDKITFASTAVGYEKDGEIVPSRVANTILSRAYVTVEYNGDTVTFYSSQYEKDLTSACRATLEDKRRENLDESAKTFLDDLIKLDINKDYIYSKAEALDHLTAIYNDSNHILSGQHIGPGRYTVRNSLDKIYAATGKMPAVLSYDVSVAYRDLGENYETNIGFVADDFAEYAKQGGLITMCAHMTNPDPEQVSKVYKGDLSKDQWDQLLLINNYAEYEDTEIHTNFMTELSAIADFLQLLEDRRVTVFWRPYHEANITSFWFCGTNIPKCDCEYTEENPTCTCTDICEHGDEEISVCYFKQLWEMTYDYLVDTRKLGNLIWVYSPHMAKDNGGTHAPVMEYYPGDAYVDVMGLDVYHNTDTLEGADPVLLTKNYENNWSNLAGTGKPVVYGEFGPGGKLIHCDPKLSYNGEDALDFVKRVEESGRRMGWVVFWRSQSDNWLSLDLMDKADAFMQDGFVYDLDEARTIILDNHYNSLQG